MSTDLHLANILLRLPLNMQNMTVEQFRSRTDNPAKKQVIREDGAPLDPDVPSEAIVPIWLGLGSDEISVAESAIIIADFGEAFDPRERQHFTSHTPLLLAPPESRFAYPDEPLSFQAIYGHLHARSGIFSDPGLLSRISLFHWMGLQSSMSRCWGSFLIAGGVSGRKEGIGLMRMGVRM